MQWLETYLKINKKVLNELLKCEIDTLDENTLLEMHQQFDSKIIEILNKEIQLDETNKNENLEMKKEERHEWLQYKFNT